MKGVKGALPLGCLPLWGREGVTLIKNGEILEPLFPERFPPEILLNSLLFPHGSQSCDASHPLRGSLGRLGGASLGK
jgi:hypothetical protein